MGTVVEISVVLATRTMRRSRDAGLSSARGPGRTPRIVGDPAMVEATGAPSGPRCDVHLANLRCLEPHHHALLDKQEARRRARFRGDVDRDRFTLATVLLRALVARRTNVDFATATIDRTCDVCGEPHGRPRLAHPGLEASISHAGDVVAVALTAAGPVGVDIEVVAPGEYESLIASVCTPDEQEFVRGPHDFYTYWTRKEAVLKATGEGLRRPMTDLVVTAPDTAPSLLALATAPSPPMCRMADVPAGDGYVGSVAVLDAEAVEFTMVDATGFLSEL
jgi:4'-phosphopantetheinyl transferase